MATFETLTERLGNRDSRKLANNTYLQRRGSSLAIKLHETDVLTFHPGGSIILDSGGWHTPTTKARMNDYLPSAYSLYQKAGVWYLHVGPYCSNGVLHCPDTLQGNIYRYADGLTINADGSITGYDPETPKADKALKAKVKAYAQLCTSQLPLPMPTNGDCWYCSMYTENGRTLGEVTPNTEHLLSHMREPSVVPSLVWRALEVAGYQPSISMVFGVAFGDTTFPALHSDIERAIRRYMLKQLGYAV